MVKLFDHLCFAVAVYLKWMPLLVSVFDDDLAPPLLVVVIKEYPLDYAQATTMAMLQMSLKNVF